MGGSSPGREISRGMKRAREALSDENVFGSVTAGLDLAPDFFARLRSDELSGTPLGQGLQLQEALLDEALLGLRGETNFNIGSLGTAAADQINSQLAARGLGGGPASALQAAEKLTGFSEGIRAQRLNQSLAILGGTSAAGSVLPSASAFLQLGANKQSQLAGLELQAGIAKAGMEFQEDQAMGSLVSTGLGLGLGGLAGGFGALGAFGIQSGFGGALAGAGLGSGLFPFQLS